jgi:hypothetical protein
MFTDELAAVGMADCNLSKANEEAAVGCSPDRLNVVRWGLGSRRRGKRILTDGRHLTAAERVFIVTTG